MLYCECCIVFEHAIFYCFSLSRKRTRPGNILRRPGCSNIVNGMTDLNYAYSPSFALALVVTAVTFLEQIIRMKYKPAMLAS